MGGLYNLSKLSCLWGTNCVFVHNVYSSPSMQHIHLHPNTALMSRTSGWSLGTFFYAVLSLQGFSPWMPKKKSEKRKVAKKKRKNRLTDITPKIALNSVRHKMKSLFFYVTRTLGVTGTLHANGKIRDNRVFHKLSCYITQEDLIQPLLTVQEIMMVAARLKLPSHTSEKHRLDKVIIIIIIIEEYSKGTLFRHYSFALQLFH